MSKVDQEIELAQFIRQVNGDNKMGAARLAEAILGWQSARDAEAVNLRDALQRVDPLSFNNFDDLLEEMVRERITVRPTAKPESQQESDDD